MFPSNYKHAPGDSPPTAPVAFANSSKQGKGEEQREDEALTVAMAAATSFHCCLNASPPNPSPTPALPQPTLSPWPATARKDASWRSRCVSTAACVILGSAVGLAEVGSGGDSLAHAYAADEMPAAAGAGVRPVRWSEMRECPPWRANSLENIVPENLPRPSARRRSETVRMSRNAPAVAGSSVGTARGGCYSL